MQPAVLIALFLVCFCATDHVRLLLRRLWIRASSVEHTQPNVQGAAGKKPVAVSMGPPHAFGSEVCVCMCVCTCARMCVYVCVCMYVYGHVCMYVCMCEYVCTCWVPVKVMVWV